MMKQRSKKRYVKNGAGKMVAGILIGSLVGATVGWLTAPASGEETRRRLTGDLMGHREKLKRSTGNLESQARELFEQVEDHAASSKNQIG
jgi:gas vesicle protein